MNKSINIVIVLLSILILALLCIDIEKIDIYLNGDKTSAHIYNKSSSIFRKTYYYNFRIGNKISYSRSSFASVFFLIKFPDNVTIAYKSINPKKSVIVNYFWYDVIFDFGIILVFTSGLLIIIIRRKVIIKNLDLKYSK